MKLSIWLFFYCDCSQKQQKTNKQTNKQKQDKKNLTSKELKILQAVSTFLTGEVNSQGEFLHVNITFP